MRPFGLRRSFVGGQKGIRSVAIWDQGAHTFVATGGMDGSIKLWSLQTGDLISTLAAHSGSVSCLLFKDDVLISGSFDHSLKMWKNGVCINTFLSHTEEVSCFALVETKGEDNKEICLVSGSWDKTLKIWRAGQLQQTLKGHEHGIMAVAALPNGDIVSGSGEGKLVLWKMPQGNSVPLYGGHKMCVRCLVFGNGKLWSSANDGEVKVWERQDEGGQLVLRETIQTGDEYMYSLGTIFPTEERKEEVVSVWTGGEKGEAAVWGVGPQGGSVRLQTLPHPAALWGMASKTVKNEIKNENDKEKEKEKEMDVEEVEEKLMVTGSGDGVARVWSTSPLNWILSPEEYMNEFQEARAAEVESKRTQSNPEIPVSTLAEVLSRQGKYAGETVKVDTGAGATSFFKWNQPGMTWEEVGAMETQTGNKQDIFPISTDGNNTYTLKFQHGSNPYHVAQEFIIQNQLNPNFVTQIVEYIIKNTTDPAISKNLTGDFSSLQPTGQPSPNFSNSKWKTFPGGIEKAKAKIEEFWGEAVTANAHFQALCSTLQHQGQPSKEQIDVLFELLNGPQEKIFPVLDILRASLLQNNFLSHLVPFSTPTGNNLVQFLVSVGTKEGGPPPAWLFSFRSLSNSLATVGSSHPSALEFPYMIIAHLSEIGEGVKRIVNSGKPSGFVRAAIATFFYNLFLFISYQGIVLMPEVSENLCHSLQKMGEFVCESGDDGACLIILSSLSIAQTMAEEGGMDFVQNPAIRALLNTIESSFHLSVEALEKAQQLLNKQKRRKVQ